MKTVKETAAALRCCGNSECDCKNCSYIAEESCFDKLRYDSADLLEYLEDKCNAAIAGQETLQKALAEKNAEAEKIVQELAMAMVQFAIDEVRLFITKKTECDPVSAFDPTGDELNEKILLAKSWVDNVMKKTGDAE